MRAVCKMLWVNGGMERVRVKRCSKGIAHACFAGHVAVASPGSIIEQEGWIGATAPKPRCHWRRSARRDVAVVRLCVCVCVCFPAVSWPGVLRAAAEGTRDNGGLGTTCKPWRWRASAKGQVCSYNGTRTRHEQDRHGDVGEDPRQSGSWGWQKTQRPRSRFPRGCSDYEEVDRAGT